MTELTYRTFWVICDRCKSEQALAHGCVALELSDDRERATQLATACAWELEFDGGAVCPACRGMTSETIKKFYEEKTFLSKQPEVELQRSEQPREQKQMKTKTQAKSDAPLPGQTQLRPGDVVLLDGGEHTIKSVSDGKAVAEPIDKKWVGTGDPRGATKEIRASIPRNLFIRHATKESDSYANLEPGDEFACDGQVWTVIEVKGDTATVGTLDGRVETRKTRINTFFFQGIGHSRRDADGREKHLIQFLAQRQQPVAAGATPQKKGNEMKSRTTKVKTPGSRGVKPPAGKPTTSNGEAKCRGKVFGHSAVRVVQALGKAGMTAAEVATAMEGQGVMLSASTIVQNVRKGKNGIEGMAVLTKEQLGILKAVKA